MADAIITRSSEWILNRYCGSITSKSRARLCLTICNMSIKVTNLQSGVRGRFSRKIFCSDATTCVAELDAGFMRTVGTDVIHDVF